MNLLLLYTVCGLLTFFIVYAQRKCWYFVWQLNGWRGIFQQPLLWLYLIVYMDPKTLMTSIQRYRKYFQFPQAIIVFNRILLYVDDPDNMESILTTPECLNKSFTLNGFYANKGLLHAKDEQWKIRRKQLSPVFSQSTLLSFFETFNCVANKLNIKLFQAVQEANEVKFQNLDLIITQAVLEMSFLTTMGYETNILQNDDKGIAQAYKYLMEMSALRVVKFWYQIDFVFRLLDNKNYEKSKRANKLVTEFVTKIVQQKHFEWQQLQLRTTNTRKNNDDEDASNGTATKSSPRNTMSLHEQENKHKFSDANVEFPEQNITLPMQRNFIDQLFYLAQAGKLTLDDIMNESQSMIFVSFETVSSFVISTLLLLAINRECQMKLRNEIKQTLPFLSKNRTGYKKDATTTAINHQNNDIKNNNNQTPKVTSSSYTNTTGISDCNTKQTANNSSTHDAGCDDNNKDDDDIDMQVTMEHLLNMPYLDMIINESLRLLAIVPTNLRSASADFQLNVKQQKRVKYTHTPMTTLKSNINTDNTGKILNSEKCLHTTRSIRVPKDTIFALDVFNMQRNEMYWGSNALKFYPEHFIKNHQQKQQQQRQQQHQNQHQRTGKSIKTVDYNKQEEQDEEQEQEQEQVKVPTSAFALRHSFDFIPFSKGLRSCIGYRYSNYLSKIILINLISSFEFSTNVQLQDLQFQEGISLKIHNAHKIFFQIQPVNCTSSSS